MFAFLVPNNSDALLKKCAGDDILIICRRDSLKIPNCLSSLYPRECNNNFNGWDRQRKTLKTPILFAFSISNTFIERKFDQRVEGKKITTSTTYIIFLHQPILSLPQIAHNQDKLLKWCFLMMIPQSLNKQQATESKSDSHDDPSNSEQAASNRICYPFVCSNQPGRSCFLNGNLGKWMVWSWTNMSQVRQLQASGRNARGRSDQHEPNGAITGFWPKAEWGHE